jgi:hypothetical protein
VIGGPPKTTRAQSGKRSEIDRLSRKLGSHVVALDSSSLVAQRLPMRDGVLIFAIGRQRVLGDYSW